MKPGRGKQAVGYVNGKWEHSFKSAPKVKQEDSKRTNKRGKR